MSSEKTPVGAGESSPAPDGSAIRFRLLALYHNCHSGAAFARCDAETTEDHAQKRVHWREAIVYETCAGWIKAAMDTLPNAGGHRQVPAKGNHE